MRIDVKCGSYVDGIKTTYLLAGVKREHQHGSTDTPNQLFEVGDNEYIVEISGKYGSKLDSFTVKTSRGRYHTFGGGGGSTSFIVPAKYKCVIAAFHGRSGSIMNAIGATYVNAHMLRAEVIDLHFDESKMTVIPGTQYVTKHVCS